MITPLLFTLGTVVATPDAIRRMQALHIDPASLLKRHANGDWGELCPEDKETNDQSVKTKGMILSCYGKDDKRIWIITDPGHETTTLLLPENY